MRVTVNFGLPVGTARFLTVKDSEITLVCDSPELAELIKSEPESIGEISFLMKELESSNHVIV